MAFSKQDTVNVATTSTSLLSAASNRTAILVSAPPTNRVTLSLTGSATLDQGLTLYPSGAVLALTKRDHGDIVTRAWNAISSTAAQNITVISVFET